MQNQNYSLRLTKIEDEIYRPPEAIIQESLAAIINNVNHISIMLSLGNQSMSGETIRVSLDNMELQDIEGTVKNTIENLHKITKTLYSQSQLQNPEDDFLEFKKEDELKYEIYPPNEFKSIEIGTAFDTLEDAEEAFKEYAIASGFNICRGNSKTNAYQDFACTCRGRARQRKIKDEHRQRNRASRKTQCKCMISLKHNGLVWVVRKLHLGHTHQLMTPSEVRKTARHRFIPKHIQELALKMQQEGYQPARIHSYLQERQGSNCTWQCKDMYNFLYRFR